MPRITKSVEERRQEIIDTARLMFLETGFENTQMADISKKMNVAAGTIFHYFKSKLELLYAVIDELTYEKARSKSQFLNGIQGSAFDRLKMIFTSFEDELNEKMNVRFSDDPAIIQHYMAKLVGSFLPIFASLIVQGNDDGSWSCEYPEEIAMFILQGFTGVMSLTRKHDDPIIEKKKRIKAIAKAIYRVLDIPEEKNQ